MKKFFRCLNCLLAQPIIWLIKIYQWTLSPDMGLPSFWLKGRVCAHHPHCSSYSVHVLKRYGFWPGIWYASDRVLHCTPSMTVKYDPPHYRVVFFSGAPIGVPFLQALKEDERFEVVGVVSQADKPVGRGLEVQENVIKKEAKVLSLSDEAIVTPEKLNPEKSDEGKQFFQWLSDKEPDFLVVIAYGKIIPQSILDVAKIAPINVHGSILPKYRGASPIQSVFLHKEKVSGITIMKMDKGMDTGDIIDILATKLHFDRTSRDLIEWMEYKGPEFLNDTLWKYGKEVLGSKKQDDTKATYCSKIEKEEALIHIQKDPLEAVYLKYKAFFLWPKIYFMFEGKRVIIESLILDQEIFDACKEIPLVNTTFEISQAVTECIVKPEGKKAMTWDEFLRGYVK